MSHATAAQAEDHCVAGRFNVLEKSFRLCNMTEKRGHGREILIRKLRTLRLTTKLFLKLL